MIAFKVRSPKEIKNRISEELKDPIYKDIMQVQNHPAFLEDPFIKQLPPTIPTCDMIYVRNKLKRNSN